MARQGGPFTSVPAQALPILFQYLAGDLRSLISAACVNHDWRVAATNTPEVWQSVRFPKKLACKVTDEGLKWVLRNLKDLGVTSLNLNGCALLTDRSVGEIIRVLKRVPKKLILRGCSGMTWREVERILRHVQGLFDKRQADGAANRQEAGACQLPKVRFDGVNFSGCIPEALARMTRLPMIGGALDHMALCEECRPAQLLEKCAWCEESSCLKHYDDTGACVRCKKAGCLDHFEDMRFRHCNCLVCDDCLDENQDGGSPCYMCKFILCPVCDSDARRSHGECQGACDVQPNMICDPCRLEHCICKCKNEGLMLRGLREGNYPVLCEVCVQGQEHVLDNNEFDPAPATRYCNDCGLLRESKDDVDSDESSQDDWEGLSDSGGSDGRKAYDSDEDYDSWFDDLKPRKKASSDSDESLDEESENEEGGEIDEEDDVDDEEDDENDDEEDDLDDDEDDVDDEHDDEDDDDEDDPYDE